MSKTYSEIIFINFLQFFADGASGGDGGEGAGESGDNAADAGRDLEALGVPREYAERHKQRMDRKRGKVAAAAVQAEPRGPIGDKGPQGVNAITGKEGTEDSAPAANDGGSNEWDAFFSKQENKDKLQQMMAERGKAATEAKRQAEEHSKKLTPALQYLGKEFGIEPDESGNYDEDKVLKALEDRHYEDKALEMGVSADVARKLEQADALEQQQKQAAADAERREMLQNHFNQQLKSAEAIKSLVPGFDFAAELDRDPEFRRLTAPGLGRADQVYFGLHYQDILKAQAADIARRSKQAAAANVAAGGSRPRENGSSAMAAVSATPDMRTMSREQRRAYIMKKYPNHN